MWFRVNGFDEREFTGMITRVNPAAKPPRARSKCWWRFDDARQQPKVAGLYAEGRIETRSAASLTLPSASVVREGDNAFAWRVNGRQAAEGGADARRARRAQRRVRAARPASPRATGCCATRTPRCKDGQAVQPRRRRAARRRRGEVEPARGDAMFLSDFSIKRPVTTVVIIIVLMCLGLLALKKLRVNQIPDVEQPVMVVSIPYPGASPETVEREIINRIEKSLQSIPQVVPDPLDRLRGQRAASS